MNEQYLQLGSIAVIFLFAVKEFFAYLKTKKNGTTNYEKELASVNNKLDNHIATFGEDLREVRNDIKQIKEAIIDIKIKLK